MFAPANQFTTYVGGVPTAENRAERLLGRQFQLTSPTSVDAAKHVIGGGIWSDLIRQYRFPMT